MPRPLLLALLALSACSPEPTVETVAPAARASLAIDLSGVHLETGAIARGESLMGAAEALPSRHGVRRVRRGDVVESLHPHPRGVEQRWTFEHHPAGAGDLVVTVSVDGALVGQTEHGIKLEGPEGLIVYGAGTWVGADGARTPVPLGWSEGAIALRVPSEIVEDTAYPAVLDPIVGTITELEEPVLAPLPRFDQMLVVGGETFIEHGPVSERVIARVDGSGVVSEEAAASGEGYLACHPTLPYCFDTDSIWSTATQPWTLVTSRDSLPPTGSWSALGYVGVAIAGGNVVMREYDIAAAVTRERVVAPATTAHYVRCTLDGVCLVGADSTTYRVTASAITTHSFVASRDFGEPRREGFWEVTREYVTRPTTGWRYWLHFQRDTGEVLSPQLVPFQDYVGLTAEDTVVGVRIVAGGIGQVWFADDRYTSSRITEFPVEEGIGVIASPHCYAPGHCTVVVSRAARSQIALYDLDYTDGTAIRLDPGPVLRQGLNAQAEVALAATDTRLIVAYGDARQESPREVRVASRRHDLSAVAPSAAAGGGTRPRVARGRTVGTVVWNGDGSRVRAFGDDGAFLTDEAQASPLVSDALVTRGDEMVLSFGSRAQAFTVLGAPLSAEPVELVDRGVAGPLRLAASPDAYLTTWAFEGTRLSDVAALRLDVRGAPTDAYRLPLSSEDGDQSGPAPVFDGRAYQVFWRDERDGSIDAQEIALDGTIGGLLPVGVSDPAYPATGAPEAVFDGADVVLVYPSGAALVAQRVRDLAASGDPVVVDPAVENLESYSVAARDGTTFVGYVADDADGLQRVWLVSVQNAGTGLTCTVGADCDSGTCVDGVCCDRACDADCETCLAAEGAPEDGMCGVRSAGAECRASTGACDPAEVCDGAGTECPAELPPPASCEDTDAGSTGDSDAGTSGGTDAGTSGGTDSGSAPIDDAGSVTETDAGSSATPDAGEDGGGGGPCGVAPGRRSSGAAWLVAFAIVGALLRRRRAR